MHTIGRSKRAVPSILLLILCFSLFFSGCSLASGSSEEDPSAAMNALSSENSFVGSVSESSEKSGTEWMEKTSLENNIKKSAWLLTGTMQISELAFSQHRSTGAGFNNGLYNLNGRLEWDEKADRAYLELFLDPSPDGSTPAYGTEEPVLSYWVDLKDHYVQARIGDRDAWVLDRYLEPEEADRFSFDTSGGKTVLKYDYFDGNMACRLIFSFHFSAEQNPVNDQD